MYVAHKVQGMTNHGSQPGSCHRLAATLKNAMLTFFRARWRIQTDSAYLCVQYLAGGSILPNQCFCWFHLYCFDSGVPQTFSGPSSYAFAHPEMSFPRRDGSRNNELEIRIRLMKRQRKQTKNGDLKNQRHGRARTIQFFATTMRVRG